jgi:hypothetical protein
VNLRILALIIFMTLYAGAAQAGADVTLVNNAALKTGDSLVIEAYQISGDKKREVKTMAVGPVTEDCKNGCGAPSDGFIATPGRYHIEAHDKEALGTASVMFVLKPGEQYVWMVSSRSNPPTYYTTNIKDVKSLTDEGPFRIDLIGYTKVPVETPQTRTTTTAPHKKDFDLWPFRPKTRHQPVNK